MASSSNGKFCSLDMLAEVASATLQNDPSLYMIDFPLSRTKNKVGNSLSRKSLYSCEKLSLDQIKALSEKNLIEMFSELICDEMRKNYSFQCFLIPDKCSQVYKSFGNEARARCEMKIHLQSHINDLISAADVTNDDEVFMAEPLHARRKRLAEMNQKKTRKKIKVKQGIKFKKDINLGSFSEDVEDFSILKSMDQDFNTMTMSSSTYSPEANCTFDLSMNNSVFDNVNDNSVNHVSKRLKDVTYISSSSSAYDLSEEEVTFKGQSSYDSEVSQKDSVKRKHRSRHPTDTKKRTSGSCEFDKRSGSNSDINSYSNCTPDSSSDYNLPVLHDHTYTSVNGPTFNSDRPCTSENSRSVCKLLKDPSHPKKPIHRCSRKESPLIIPTPAFPYVYIPLLPHIAFIKEIGRKFKTSHCRCANALQVTDDIYEFSYIDHVPPLFKKENELSENALNQTDSNGNIVGPDNDEIFHANSYGEVFEEGRSSEINKLKLSDSPFFVDDLMRNENPGRLKAGEKKLALNCIRALRTKKKDERGPLTCQICKNKSFTAQATLMYHYRSHAGIKPFACTICDATFTRQHSLNYHMLIHKNESRFICSDCGRSFRHPSHYKEHLKRHSEETSECTDYNVR